MSAAESSQIVVGGGGLTAVVAPRRGAKIMSLRDSSREWLAQAVPDAPPPPPGAAFTDAEMSGWDECAPSIVGCTVDGKQIPDHGSLWDAAFTVSDTTTTFRTDDFSFSRTIEPTPGGLRLQYRASGLRGPFPFLWAAHPQFVAPPGTYVRLPASVTTVVDVLGEGPEVMPWTPEIAGIMSISAAGCRKVYANPTHPVSSAVLVHPDGGELALEWSEAAPYLGIWFDNRAFSREPVIALEPSTGYYDSLATALAHRRVPILKPGSPLEWWLEIRSSALQ